MTRKQATQADEPDRELLRHIQELGLADVAAYQQWCTENGFGKKLNKHWKQRCKERQFASDLMIRDRLSQKKREKRRYNDLLAAICNGTISANEVTQQPLKRLCNVVQSKRSAEQDPSIDRKSLLRLLTHLQQCRAKVLDGAPAVAALGQAPGNTSIEALALTASYAGAWLRPVEGWKPRTHNASKQMASLLRHLFVQYDDMPTFFDSVWFSGQTAKTAKHRRWYLHVGRGQNIRHCDLPVAYTKKMAHWFMRAPSDASLEQALRWGQVLGLGGDEPLAIAVMGTRLSNDWQHEDFWSSVLRWLIEFPMLDRAQVGPIIDYLYHQRFVSQPAAVGAGGRNDGSPPQPNLSMKGRTPEALLRNVNQWHRKLAIDNTMQFRQWQPSGIESFELIEGNLDKPSFKCWTIRELLSSKALVAEGRQLKHCVATYATSCARGHCSIWTVELESFEGLGKRLTVEVRNQSRMIVQVRGKANRLPTIKEKAVLARWAAATGLKVASYV